MRARTAVSLIELIVVLSILAAFSCLLIPCFSGTIEDANEVATKKSLVEIRDALIAYWLDIKHVTLDGMTTVAANSDRLHIDWLFANPVTGDQAFDFDFNSLIGWRGPYLAESTGSLIVAGSPFVIDAWNNEIKIHDVDPSASQRDVRIVSGGPDGTITIPTATATSALTTNEIGDDIYVALQLR
jgi:type II secretory pathway pseudopilin PulG